MDFPSFPQHERETFDDFLGKSSKLAASLRSTVLALSSFLDRSSFGNIHIDNDLKMKSLLQFYAL